MALKIIHQGPFLEHYGKHFKQSEIMTLPSLYIFEQYKLYSKNKDNFINKTENLNHTKQNFISIPFLSKSKFWKSYKYL